MRVPSKLVSCLLEDIHCFYSIPQFSWWFKTGHGVHMLLMQPISCKIWGFHGGDYDDYHLPEDDNHQLISFPHLPGSKYGGLMWTYGEYFIWKNFSELVRFPRLLATDKSYPQMFSGSENNNRQVFTQGNKKRHRELEDQRSNTLPLNWKKKMQTLCGNVGRFTWRRPRINKYKSRNNL
jgi:hypothetical protein